MDFIYNVPEELKHYDSMLNSWNQMTKTNIGLEVPTIIENVVNWWEKYPQKENKKAVLDVLNVPSNVWKIFEKFKITHTEKIYGIFYTLEYLLDNRIYLQMNSIQYNDDGRVDTAVMIENFMICDNNFYDVESINFTILNTINNTVEY